VRFIISYILSTKQVKWTHNWNVSCICLFRCLISPKFDEFRIKIEFLVNHLSRCRAKYILIRTSTFVGLKFHRDPCFNHVRLKLRFYPYFSNVEMKFNFGLYLYLRGVQVEIWFLHLFTWGSSWNLVFTFIYMGFKLNFGRYLLLYWTQTEFQGCIKIDRLKSYKSWDSRWEFVDVTRN
jgi:hypothetical protein